MPYPPEHKQQSRERIIRAAAELFATQGYDAVSIDLVMAHAGLTRGAFYAHFSSKQMLYQQSISAARDYSMVSSLLSQNLSPAQTAREVIQNYLSQQHFAPHVFPCPMAFLSADVAHRDEGVRRAYSEVFDGLTQIIEQGLAAEDTGTEAIRRQRALAITAMMIGGMAVSRALHDPQSQQNLLEACMHTALGLQKEGLGQRRSQAEACRPEVF